MRNGPMSPERGVEKTPNPKVNKTNVNLQTN